MSNITIKTHEVGGNEIRVNGRLTMFARRITEVRNVRPGKWEGVANGSKFTIEGGKHAGGASNEWWLDWEGYLNNYTCSSAVEALHTIENC